MNTYELKPTAHPSIHWESSYYQGEAIVQSADETEARAIAVTAFAKAVSFVAADAEGNAP